MFRTLVIFALLHGLRIRSPELFDGARALAAINACIEQDLAAGLDLQLTGRAGEAAA
jgi:hypothetical protein